MTSFDGSFASARTPNVAPGWNRASALHAASMLILGYASAFFLSSFSSSLRSV